MSSLDHITLFRQETVDEIVRHIESDRSPEVFLQSLESISYDPSSMMSQDWEFGTGLPVLSGDDPVDAKRLHRFIGKLLPVEIADFRLWNWLSVILFREYTAARWPLDYKPENEDAWRGRAKDRWVLPRLYREGLARNSISRLWIAANVVYDPELTMPFSREMGDPYSYLNILFSRQDTMQQVLERGISSSTSVLLEFLETLRCSPDSDNQAGVRSALRELTLVFGYRDISMLPKAELVNAVQSAFVRGA